MWSINIVLLEQEVKRNLDIDAMVFRFDGFNNLLVAYVFVELICHFTVENTKRHSLRVKAEQNQMSLM